MKAFQTWIGIILIVMLALMLIFVKVVRDERTSCLKDPLIYGVKSIEKNNGQPFMCECGLLAENSPRVIVTKEGYKSLAINNQNNRYAINFSILSDVIKTNAS